MAQCCSSCGRAGNVRLLCGHRLSVWGCDAECHAKHRKCGGQYTCKAANLDLEGSAAAASKKTCYMALASGKSPHSGNVGRCRCLQQRNARLQSSQIAVPNKSPCPSRPVATSSQTKATRMPRENWDASMAKVVSHKNPERPGHICLPVCNCAALCYQWHAVYCNVVDTNQRTCAVNVARDVDIGSLEV